MLSGTSSPQSTKSHHASQLVCHMVGLCFVLCVIPVTQPLKLLPSSCTDPLMILATVHTGSPCLNYKPWYSFSSCLWVLKLKRSNGVLGKVSRGRTIIFLLNPVFHQQILVCCRLWNQNTSEFNWHIYSTE